MLTATDNFINKMIADVRTVAARVELYNGATLERTFTGSDYIKSIEIERVGDSSKFFGFGVCQKLNLHLIDIDRDIDITTAHSIKVYFGFDDEYVSPFPTFFTTRVYRDEKTSEISVTAYDALYKASELTFNDLGLTAPYTLLQVVILISSRLGCTNVYSIGGNANALLRNYENGANLGGTERLRFMLDAAAEAMQTIYYIDNTDRLVFKALSKSGALITIDNSQYIELESGENRRLTTICRCTELGNDIAATTGATGTTQYVRNNPFWDMGDDEAAAALVDEALARVGGLTINQFECDWRGNLLLEVGDKIAFITRDQSEIITYLLDDIVNYNGALTERSRWHFEDTAETPTNPTNLGDALNKTYAYVDKKNQEITLGVVSLSNEIGTLATKVEQKVTAEDVVITVEKTLQEGVKEVKTSTDYTFNDEGLTIGKSDSKITTQITEDGMTVKRSSKALLVANSAGVDAANLHATTYLLIGDNSRLQDYGSRRTGCFWIGD